MNKKNVTFLALLVASSWANSVYAQASASNPSSIAYLRDVLLNLRGSTQSWAHLCTNNQTSCRETPQTSAHWTRILNASNLLPQLGFSESQTREAGALSYISFNVPEEGASANGPTITFTGEAGTFATCRLHSPSASAILPTALGGVGNIQRITVNAFQIAAGGTQTYSQAGMFSSGGQAPGGNYYLLCVTHTLVDDVAMPVPAQSGALGASWGKV